MKRFFTISFIALALIVSAAGVAPAAHADCVQGTANCDPCPPGDSACLAAAQVSIQSAATGGINIDPAAAKTTKEYKAPETNSTDAAYNGIMQRIMLLFAWLVGVAAMTLDYAVFYTVVKMGDFVNHLSAIGVTWRILRDIGNIMLIFGFLAVGITTILNVDWYGGGKKMLPMMFVAAVFLNFSLFISEAIIDTGNLFATQFFTQINGGVLPTSTSLSQLTVANEGISNKIMSQLGLQSLYDVNKGQVRTKIFDGSSPWLVGFMGIILFIVTAFVMFSLAFVLIARFVALIFLLVVAPIGFAGLAIPGFAARAHDWWTQLFHQTITAPILLLMLYIALAVITDAQFLVGFNSSSDGWLGFVDENNLAGFGGVVLSFLVAMGLLVSVVIYAKRWSAFGGDWASRMGAKLSFGLTAAGMRGTVGLGSNLAAQAIRRSPIKATKFGRVMATTFDKGAKGSFDLRGTGVLAKIPFGSSIDAGKPQEGGYRKRQEDTIKAHQEYIKSVTDTIDEHGTNKKEEDAILKAEATQKDASAAQAAANISLATAKNEYAAAKAQLDPQIEAQKAEIARLEAEKSKDRFWDASGREPQLEAAKQRLATIQQPLGAAMQKQEAADKAVKAAVATLKIAEDAVEAEIKKSNARIGNEKKDAQRRYAANISGPLPVGSVPGWAMFGPGGNEAAKKIIKDARKNPTKEFTEKLRKAVEAEDAGGTAAGATAAHTAPPVVPTGGAGGGGAAGGATPAH